MGMTSGRAKVCIRGHISTVSPELKRNPPRLIVTQRKCNHSAFNGYHHTRSDYSTVRCCECWGHWRSKAGYVASLPDAPDKWWDFTPEQLIKWFDKQAKKG